MNVYCGKRTGDRIKRKNVEKVSFSPVDSCNNSSTRAWCTTEKYLKISSFFSSNGQVVNSTIERRRKSCTDNDKFKPTFCVWAGMFAVNGYHTSHPRPGFSELDGGSRGRIVRGTFYFGCQIQRLVTDGQSKRIPRDVSVRCV